jgi:hypothetical protein
MHTPNDQRTSILQRDKRNYPMKFPALSQLLLFVLATFMMTDRVVTGTEPSPVDWEIPADTNQITSLTPDQARKLVSQHTQRILQLNGLSELTPPVAVHIKKFRGDRIELNGVANLSATVASHLNEFGGNRIDMNGLHTLTPHAADEIMQFEGHLSFDGLATLSPETANNLRAWNFRAGRSNPGIVIALEPGANDDFDAQFEKAFMSMFDNPRRQLSLNGLTELSPEAAQHLAEYSGSRLALDGLRAISLDAAKPLARFKGKELSLCGLSSLPDDVARALSERKGPLFLRGLTTLSDEAAQTLKANPAIVLPVTFSSERTQSQPNQQVGTYAEPGVGAGSR